MSTTPAAQAEPILLAFSGGLDTSFCVPWLKETYNRPVITVTVDTGGIDSDAARVLAERSVELGAGAHHLVDARAAYWDRVLKFLVIGNARRGQMYPLCVGAERVLQAQTIADLALRLGTRSVAHGCTAAGNDQVRFEVALRTLAPSLEIIAPVRDRAFKRPEQLAFDGQSLAPVALVEALEAIGGPYGIGRGIHLGDTVIGTKGRVAYEAPAAEILLCAHRELEKLVLTGRQIRIKDTVAGPYGDLVHEGQHLDPVCRDIEALLLSSQARVTGEVALLLRPGALFVEGVTSPHSLM